MRCLSLCLVLCLHLVHGSRMFGLSSKSALVSINLTTGNMTELTPEHREELDAQELSAIDASRQRYYTVGVNQSSKEVNLCIWSLTSGIKERSIKLPFYSSPLVGFGEAIDVDPTDGTIVLMGHDPTRSMHHTVYTADPDSFNFTFVADLGGDIHVDLMGATTALDYDAKNVYLAWAYNDSATKKPAVELAAVSLASGTVTKLPNALFMAGYAYDSRTRRIYGTQWEGGQRSLAYFDVASPSKGLTAVAPLGLSGAVGDLHALDTTARVHYSLLLDKPKATKPYTPTTYCSDHGEPCASGSTCCCEPPPPPEPAQTIGTALHDDGACAYAYCYAVANCSKIPSGADPLKVKAYIVGVSIDDGSQVVKTPLCSLEPSPATVPAACPWSIEVASG